MFITTYSWALAADQGNVSALCFFYLTAAFDTVDHDLLMLRLERQFGLCGVVLQWFSSYLSDRTFQVAKRCIVVVELFQLPLNNEK